MEKGPYFAKKISPAITDKPVRCTRTYAWRGFIRIAQLVFVIRS